ncbi:probable mediator of RNA polymerase II transcription subunit 26c [Zingiber officinale]|uniref:probable mediator of RNA polymerase II transcription subunit 26c n=1 Tax=Zingiber officinale TaxID=94328 RepID=UPI001C4D85FE|nr:probable mediator of RNA polymerase II transcription subunit 26c [Zingiber officinale]
METDDLRRLMRGAGLDLWSLIDAAISVAAAEHGEELRSRRDGIVQRLYSADGRCGNCGSSGGRSGSPVALKREEARGRSSPWEKRIGAGEGASPTPSPDSMNNAVEVDDKEEEQEEDAPRSYSHSIEEEKRKILAIKQFLDDTDQPEDSLVSLLQNLADMDITFKTLKETDIGRHVNNHRKHPSNEVRQLVKQLVRKWKDLVDEWAKSNSTNDTASPAIISNGDSPQQIHGRNSQNGNQIPEFGNSPNSNAVGYLNTEGYSSEPIETKVKKPAQNPAKYNGSSTRPLSSASLAKAKEQRDNSPDAEKLAFARKRLHENYLEAQNAKKQRTIQVMDIHEIPKPKNSFVRKGVFHGKH